MDEFDRLKELTEGILDRKVSKLEHAKRMGRAGMKETISLLEVLIQANKIRGDDTVEAVENHINELREYLKILGSIK